MLSKEQILEIISYRETHGVWRKDRLRELGITEWDFYKSRRRYLRQENMDPEGAGTFIQLESEGGFAPATVTEMERQIKPGRQSVGKGEELTVECRTSRGGMVRILLDAILQNLAIRERPYAYNYLQGPGKFFDGVATFEIIVVAPLMRS